MPAGQLCSTCEGSLTLAPPQVVRGANASVTVLPVFAHRGAAVRLVHNLKYRRSTKAARFLATEMARRVPPDATALVPVPRVLFRRAMYGIDQTTTLATLISDATGVPVARGLRVPVWAPRSAGRGRADRRIPVFGRRPHETVRPVLVDDVCTTGSTLIGAATSLGFGRVPALVATVAGTMWVRIDDTGNREVA